MDLSTSGFRSEPSLPLGRRFLGGRGINHWLLLREMRTGVAPFGPDTVMVLGTGALSGTPAPGSGRLNICGPNPLTGGIGSGSAGGLFAPELRFAGYDHILLTGRAARPSYLWIEDDRIALRDAAHLWGRSTWETDRAIRDELSAEDIQTVTIGPAGENLVNLACVLVSPARVVGRCGLGAVMGSKNLKAIAVKGSGRISLHDEARFNLAVKRVLDKIRGSATIQRTAKYGTVKAASPTRPVRNYQEEYLPPETIKSLHHDIIKAEFEEDKYPCCFNCPINCGRNYLIKEGDYAGTRARKLEANALSDFGPKLGILGPAAIINLQSLCDRLGLDMDNTAGVVAWAMECYQRGLLSRSEADGLDLCWGNHRAVAELVERIAHRRGIGDLLSLGCKKASEILGRQSHRFCLHIKGQELMEAIRWAKAWALGVVVSERGGGHTRGAPLCDLKGIAPETGERLWGVPEAADPTLYQGKAKIVVYYERFHAVLDSLGICALLSNWADPVLPDPGDYAELLTAATGQACASADLMDMGERIHTLGKVYNMIHAGFSRQDDYPPERLMRESISQGPFQGQVLESGDWDRMLDEYYDLHGWDRRTGWCGGRSLRRLGLPEAAEMIETAGVRVDSPGRTAPPGETLATTIADYQ